MKMGLKIFDESFGPILTKLYSDPSLCLDQSVLVLFECYRFTSTTSLMLNHMFLYFV